ncbi:MAG TPA: PAS domain S-box protein, partial [Zoogloea sp.]|nr:PAS domain S-box protein [Zoogloea sp.]
MSPLLTEPFRDTLIREAFRQARGGIPMTILAIIGIAWIHWLDTHTLIAPMWTFSALAISFGRAVILGFVLRHQDRLNIRLREWLFNGPLILSSLVWASLPVVAFPAASDHEKFGILCVLAGLAGGAASVLAPVRWPARIYLFCVLIPGAALIRLDTIGPVLSTLGVCFFVVMLLSHATARELLIEAIRKRSENQSLLADLQRERGEVEKLNLDLRAAETALRAQNSVLEHEVAVRSERNRLAFAVIQNTAEGVLVTDADGTIIEVNPAFTRITGYSAEEAIGVTVGLLTPDGPKDRQQAQMMEVLAETGKWEGELWSRRKDGSLYLERRSIDAVRDANGTTTHYVSVFNDITEDHHKDEQLRHMACHDPLTGLANRSLLNEHLRMAIAQGKRQ